MRRDLTRRCAGMMLAAALLAPGFSLAFAAREIAREAPLMIESSGRLIALRVEVVDTPELRRRGLMFRQRLPQGRGMLFLWGKPGVATLWMKNTLIPLDMVFIDGIGRIIHIHENAQPGDLQPITAGRPTLAVLEIAAGEARRLGLKKGDRVALPRR